MQMQKQSIPKPSRLVELLLLTFSVFVLLTILGAMAVDLLRPDLHSEIVMRSALQN
jgi:hypothetical protein